MPEPSTPPRVTARQIAELLAWSRSLSEHAPQIDDPDERAAFLKAKIELLGSIAEGDTADGDGA